MTSRDWNPVLSPHKGCLFGTGCTVSYFVWFKQR